jgi:hypothetical protein
MVKLIESEIEIKYLVISNEIKRCIIYFFVLNINYINFFLKFYLYESNIFIILLKEKILFK